MTLQTKTELYHVKDQPAPARLLLLFFFFGRSLVELKLIASLQVLLGLTSAIELADKIHPIQVPLLVTV